ncbi:hypothetical protein IIA79_00330 [bacterium]|nr:hypothetical protein [bacterium]
MVRYWLVLLCTALPLLAAADEAAELDEAEMVKAGHQEAVRRYFASMEGGLKLSGSVIQNDSRGTFEAIFSADSSLITHTYGDLTSYSYTGKEGFWQGSNYSLPYELEAEDNPASTVMNLISNGSYLEEPLWQDFHYLGEDAGGYNFRFSPEGLPAVDIVLYSDPEDPRYLQLMSSVVPLSPNDPKSITYRSYYYYETDEEGRIITTRETGREIDHNGNTVDFTEFIVENTEFIESAGEEIKFSFARTPVGSSGEDLDGPITISVGIDKGYFMVPIIFEEEGETRYFLFDSGSSATLFTPEAAEAAGLLSSLTITGHGHGSRAEFEVGLYSGASLGYADAPAEEQIPLAGFPAAIIPESSTEVLDAMSFIGASGIFGVSLLHQYVVTFDYQDSSITLWPLHKFNADNDVGQPNVMYWLDVEDLIYVKGRIGGGEDGQDLEGEVVIDTGLQLDLSLLEETLDLAGLEFEKVGTRASTVVGGIKQFDHVLVPSFDMGPLHWENLEATLTEDDRGTLSARGLLGFVGISLFKNNRITLDLFAQRMYVEPLDPSLAQQGMGGKGEQDQDEDEDEHKTNLPVNISRAAGEPPG